MAKIVINSCYGGFSLSNMAVKRYEELGGSYQGHNSCDRNDPILVQVVEELGDDANGSCAELEIVELPAGTLYRITEYDGYESIETPEDIYWDIA
jgi:hypothetical protein